MDNDVVLGVAGEIRHLMRLAKLELNEVEIERFAGQFGAVFELMDSLAEVDTEGVLETDQVTGLSGVMREDVSMASGIEDAIIAISPMRKVGGQIAIKAVIAE